MIPELTQKFASLATIMAAQSAVETDHICKSWSPFFQAIKAGDKTHDLRIDDRGFKVGDIITLAEYMPFEGGYTGDQIDVVVTYITSAATPCAFSSAVLAKGYVILSIKLVTAH